MRHGPLLIVALLLYITLDFSLAAMPGAFMFEPADSVESIQGKIGRATCDVAGSLPLATGPFAQPLSSTEFTERRVSSTEVVPVPWSPVVHPARGRLAPPSSEDPQ